MTIKPLSLDYDVQICEFSKACRIVKSKQLNKDNKNKRLVTHATDWLTLDWLIALGDKAKEIKERAANND